MNGYATPDTLDEFDRRVYDLAVQPMPLAEIAVRLGVPVPQAEERIQRVCGRLGVADRAGLRALTEPRALEEPVAHEAALEEPAMAPPAPKHSRRSFVIAGAAALGVAGLGAGAVALSFRGGGKTQAPVQIATTPQPIDDGLTRVAFDEVWEVKHFAKGELIDWPHGLFLMWTNTGDTTGFRLRIPEALDYRTWPGGRFISGMSHAQDQLPTGFLMDVLNTETSWSWDPQKMRLLAAVGGLPKANVIFEKVTEENQNKGTGELTIFASDRPATDFNVSFVTAVYPTGFDARMISSASGTKVAVASVEEQLTVTFVDLERKRLGGAAVGFPHSTADGARLGITGLENAEPDGPGTDSVLVSWARFEDQTGKHLEEWMTTIDWELKEIAAPVPVNSPASFSPNGRLYLREVPLRNILSEGADGPREYWPAVEVVDSANGLVLERIRSASIYYGDGGSPRRWRDVGSFVALVRSAKEEDGWDLAVFRAPKVPGFEQIERHPFEVDPSLAGAWFQSPWVQGAVPSPGAPLVALGRFTVLNTDTGEVVRANVHSEAGPAHIDPWAAGSSWLTFAFPHLGHGGASPPVLLQPKFESGDAPIDGPLQFKVASTRTYPPVAPRDGPALPNPAASDRLNVREQPSLQGKVLGSLADGAALTLADSPDPTRPIGRKSVEQTAEGATWLYVRAADGLEGWVNSAYVEWA
jgi:hypothetical protein